MFQLTLNFKTVEELTSTIALLGGTSVKAISALSATEQSRLRADAVVVPPKADKEPTAAEKKAADKAAKKAAEEAAAAEAAAAEAAALGEGGEEETDGEEALTHDDVKKLLIEVRTAYPKKPTIIAEIVKEHGKAAKISDVEGEHLSAVAAHCRKLLKEAA